MRLQAGQHDVGAKARHTHRRMTTCQQPRIQAVQRSLADHQQRVAVAELVGRLHTGRPLQAGQALLLGVKTGQAVGGWGGHLALKLRQKVGEPLRRQVAHVKGGQAVVPDGDLGIALVFVQVQVKRQHAGCAQHQLVAFELGGHQRQLRRFALGDEITLGVHHHPGAVKFEAGVGQQRLLQGQAGTRFHGINKKLRNAGVQVARGQSA